MPSLYTTYRPKNFAALVGQEHIVELLKAELSSGKTAQSYIFIGPRGTGKTTSARIFAKALNCENLQKDGSPCDECTMCKSFSEGKFLDLFEIDAASNRGIDEIREMKEKIEFKPTQGKRKIYIIDEVHMLTKEAFNALLKTLEEPPSHVVFILATTEPHKIPLTILSRCEKLEFRLGSEEEIGKVISDTAANEGAKIDQKALNLLVQFAAGSYRDSLSILDTIITSLDENKTITYDSVQRVLGLPAQELVVGYAEAVFTPNSEEAFAILEQIFTRGVNVSQYIKSVVTFLRDVFVGRQSLKNTPATPYLVKSIAILLDAYTQQRHTFDHKLPLQLATMNIISLFDNAPVMPKVAQPVKQEVPKVQPTEKPEVKKEAEEAVVLTEIKEEIVIKEVKEQEVTQNGAETKESEGVVFKQPDVVQNTNSELKIKNSKLKKSKKQKVVLRDDLTFDEIKQKWGAFLREIQLVNTQLYAFLMTAVPNTIARDEMLQTNKLEIFVKYDFHKKRIESTQCRDAINKICQKLYGTSIQVVCTVQKDIQPMQIPHTQPRVEPRQEVAKPVENTHTKPAEAAAVAESEVGADFDAIMGAEIENFM
jgi:DNA polymerase-3 subunit gamma/tau